MSTPKFKVIPTQIVRVRFIDKSGNEIAIITEHKTVKKFTLYELISGKWTAAGTEDSPLKLKTPI